MKKKNDMCTHHYIIDDELYGICKNCGEDKQFDPEPIDTKDLKRYWDVSLELLQDYLYEKDNKEDESEEEW